MENLKSRLDTNCVDFSDYEKSDDNFLENVATCDENVLENYMDKGIRKVICTDISCDGMLSGPSIDLYKEMLAKFPDLYLMASGGVSKVDDIVALDEAGVPGVIFGKALYEGHITLQDLRIFL